MTGDILHEGHIEYLEQCKELCDYLSPFLIVKCIEVPFEGKDPADLSRKEIDNLLNDML